jgi:F0F1-type ATP synthase epsilon subunit
MQLILISDEKIVFDGSVSEVNCVARNGPFTIMDNHIPFISKIQSLVSFKENNDQTTDLNITEGFIYTNGDTCVAVVETS